MTYMKEIGLVLRRCAQALVCVLVFSLLSGCIVHVPSHRRSSHRHRSTHVKRTHVKKNVKKRNKKRKRAARRRHYYSAGVEL